jgi:hypothetical protein
MLCSFVPVSLRDHLTGRSQSRLLKGHCTKINKANKSRGGYLSCANLSSVRHDPRLNLPPRDGLNILYIWLICCNEFCLQHQTRNLRLAFNKSLLTFPALFAVFIYFSLSPNAYLCCNMNFCEMEPQQLIINYPTINLHHQRNSIEKSPVRPPTSLLHISPLIIACVRKNLINNVAL